MSSGTFAFARCTGMATTATGKGAFVAGADRAKNAAGAGTLSFDALLAFKDEIAFATTAGAAKTAAGAATSAASVAMTDWFSS